jgi:hypothetical protein
VVPTIPLVTVKPMQEGVVERYMHSVTEDKLVEGMGHVQVHPEERSNVERFGRSQLCWVLKETVLEVGSGEGTCLRGRFLLPVVALLFRQWRR